MLRLDIFGNAESKFYYVEKVIAWFELIAFRPDNLVVSIFPLVKIETDFIDKFVSFDKCL